MGIRSEQTVQLETDISTLAENLALLDEQRIQDEDTAYACDLIMDAFKRVIVGLHDEASRVRRVRKKNQQSRARYHNKRLAEKLLTQSKATTSSLCDTPETPATQATRVGIQGVPDVSL